VQDFAFAMSQRPGRESLNRTGHVMFLRW